jgi:hypothetical protein
MYNEGNNPYQLGKIIIKAASAHSSTQSGWESFSLASIIIDIPLEKHDARGAIQTFNPKQDH